MRDIVENQVISHHPDRPTHSDNNFHEERQLQLNFEVLYYGQRIQSIRYHEIKSVPASQREGTMK
jgi:hypothetical protein